MFVAGMQAETQMKSQLREDSFSGAITSTFHLRYLTHLPPGYDDGSGRKWPVLLFLHGAGERGNDLDLVTVHGPLKQVKAGTNFPFIIVAPQCPADERWSVEPLAQLLDRVIAQHAVDTNRIYLTGISMGGYGTWALGLRHAERFAAMAPVCGGGNIIDAVLGSPGHVEAVRRLPVWAFHGAKDPVVPLSESERMIGALQTRAGNLNAKLTVYPEAEHDSWSETYANPALYEWFLKQRRE